jgi:hypothetical protein
VKPDVTEGLAVAADACGATVMNGKSTAAMMIAMMRENILGLLGGRLCFFLMTQL